MFNKVFKLTPADVDRVNGGLADAIHECRSVDGKRREPTDVRKVSIEQLDVDLKSHDKRLKEESLMQAIKQAGRWHCGEELRESADELRRPR